MIHLLHTMGFKVMLWICPFVGSDTPTYRELARSRKLMFSTSDKRHPAIVKWWNGQSAILDLSNPEGMDWYKSQLQYLIDEYNVDGFKLDAGDARYVTRSATSFACPSRRKGVDAATFLRTSSLVKSS